VLDPIVKCDILGRLEESFLGVHSLRHHSRVAVSSQGRKCAIAPLGFKKKKTHTHLTF